MPKDACAKVMFDAVEEFVRQGDPKDGKTITDVRFVNIDDSSVQAFRKEFISRYDNNQEHSKSNRRTGGRSVKIPPTGAEDGSSMTPYLRSDRGKNKNVLWQHSCNNEPK
ncbi:ADP-D-ribose binding [Desmophyllum pertusum]|uniref:ADP-D-ribose binding n=1 Tax=Desmophyllum pertusum TaxID=174260 RepID=A0A9W9Z6K8_9CNID|nr:ADP-D-ribose binding [Desmophyllum pertusum]